MRLPRELTIATDELERPDEVVVISPPRARVQGVNSRCTPTSSASAAIASATASVPAAISSVLNVDSLIALRIGTPRPSLSTIAASVASATVVTVAIRRPAMIAGSASGSSTRRRIWPRVIPRPAAASRTSDGTSRSPVRVLRNRISSV